MTARGRRTSTKAPDDPALIPAAINPQVPGTTGQPRKWNREVVLPVILERLGRGDTMLNVILAEIDPPIGKDTFQTWRRQDPKIAQLVDEAFELGNDRRALLSYETARGRKEGSGGHSSGDTRRDELIIKQSNFILERLDSRYNRAVKLANDPTNPLTDAKTPVDMTEADLLAIAQAGQTEKDG